MPRFLVAAAAALALALVPAAAADARIQLRVLTPSANDAAAAGVLRVAVRSPSSARVRLFARLGAVPVARARSARVRGSRTVALRLTARGRERLLRCGTPARVTVTAQRGRRARRTVARGGRTLPVRGCRTIDPPTGGGANPNRPAPPPAPGPTRVLFSADVGAGLLSPPPVPFPSDVDDAVAIVMALNARGMDVDGISVQFGNNRAEPATPKTRELVHDVMGRRDVPIAQGSSAKLPDDPATPCVNDGVRLLAEQLRRGPAVVLATGPLTDVACLARTFPREAANVTEVLAQVGARPGEAYDINGEPTLFSLNVSADPLAMEEVLTSPALAGATITASPYHLAGKVLIGDERLDRQGGDLPEGRWLRENSRAFRAFWFAGFRDRGLRTWDQTLSYRVMRPQELRTQDVGWRMVDCSDPTGRNASPACAGHGPLQFPTRDTEGKQLWLGEGPGQRPRARLRILTDFAGPAAEERFLDVMTDLRAE